MMNILLWIRTAWLCCAFLAGSSSVSSARAADAPPPASTVVLVHGAFADGSCWSEVIASLRRLGVNVVSVQNPLQSLAGDADAVKRTIDQQAGPVVLVGHSWGGMVITEAGVNPKVASLVYIAAFAPDVGMSITSLTEGRPPMPWLAELLADEGSYLHLSDKGVSQFFAPDVAPGRAGVIAAVQGPAYAGTFEDAATQAAWKTKPAWYMRARLDQMIDPQLQAQMAERIHARTVSVASGHLPMVTHPGAVVGLILAAMAPARVQP